jgi:hypothetical protein
MTLPPKLITILCLVQFFFIAAGFLVARTSLKLYDQTVPEMLGRHAPRIPPLAQFVRSYGLWFLLVPTLWCVVAVARGQVTAGDASITLPQVVIGILLTVTIVLTFTLGALYAIRISFGPF